MRWDSAARSRASARSTLAPSRCSCAIAAAAKSTNVWLISMPCTITPRRANSSRWRPGPHPTSRTREPASRCRTSTRWSTSATVPFVNEYLRYAAPIWSARGSNQWSNAALFAAASSPVSPSLLPTTPPRPRSPRAGRRDPPPNAWCRSPRCPPCHVQMPAHRR